MSGRRGRGGFAGPRTALKQATTFNVRFGGRGRGRGNSRSDRAEGGSDTRENHAPAQHRIMVYGFHTNTNEEDLKAFLINKAEVPIKFTQFSMGGGRVLLTVDSKQAANALSNLSGVKMGGISLRIAPHDTPPKNVVARQAFTSSKLQSTLLEEFIAKNYNTNDKMLDLGNLNTRIPPLKGDFSDLSFMRTLFDAIAKKAKSVVTINLSHNGIKSLVGFKQLHKQGFVIRNLCFDNNAIIGYAQLEHLRNLPLRELVFTNNPISSRNEEIYIGEVMARFSELEMLDLKKLPSLPPTQPDFFDQPDRQQLARVFLQKYFELFDKNRALLAPVYTEQSCFSVSVPTISLKEKKPKQSSLIGYLDVSRNLRRISEDIGRSTELLAVGGEIIPSIAKLPLTKHNLESFVVDCFTFTLGTAEVLNISFHGSFSESDNASSMTLRGFDRCFLLAPAPPTSKAASEGWPAVIINDQLLVREPSRLKKPTTATTTTTTSSSSSSSSSKQTLLAKQTSQILNIIQQPTPAASTPAPAPTSPAPVAVLTLEVKQQMVATMAAATGMNLRFADQCLVQNGWNYDQAIVNFKDLMSRNIIPAEAFAPLQM